MTEEPYRWLEAIGNRREYVLEQLKGGAPAFAFKMPEGILLLGVGSGNSKVFEIFDRHALVALGHPADIEKIRQAAIDAAHMEAFTRAPEDVSIRRLISFGISPQLKANFEQIYSAPFLVEMLLVELGDQPEMDLAVRLHFDGKFTFQTQLATVVASQSDQESAAQNWLNSMLSPSAPLNEATDLILQTWWCLTENKQFNETLPPQEERRAGWRSAIQEKTVELGWLSRQNKRPARYETLTLAQTGL